MYFHWQHVNSFHKSTFMYYYVDMPATSTKHPKKLPKTKWIGYRGTLPEHTAIKTDAARLGVPVGAYIPMAIRYFRKTEYGNQMKLQKIAPAA